MKKLLFAFAILLTVPAISQSEEGPLKNLRFTVSVSHLKTQAQVDHVLESLSTLEGVENERFILTDYKLSFSTTNYAMKKHMVVDSLKAILSEEGIEIEKIEQKED